MIVRTAIVMFAVGVLFAPQSADACGRWRACRLSRNCYSHRYCHQADCGACEAVASADVEATSEGQVVQLQIKLRELQLKVDSLESTVKQVPGLIEKVNKLEAASKKQQQ